MTSRYDTGPSFGQLAWEASDLLAEIAPARSQERLPAYACQLKGRARVAVERLCPRKLSEALITRNLLGEEDEAPQRHCCDRVLDHGRARRIRERCTDGAELVARAVADKAQHRQAVPAPDVERHDRYELPVGAHETDQLTASIPVMTPPCPEPFGSREDVAGVLGKAAPV